MNLPTQSTPTLAGSSTSWQSRLFNSIWRLPRRAQKLRTQIAVKVAKMVQLNKTRMNFLEEFQRMIEEYNSGAANIETFFARLMAFTQKLSEEEKRAISEELTEEELTIFDLLTKPDPVLTKAEEREVKKVAKELLQKLKSEKLVLDWKKKQATRAAVRYTVETVLDELPRTYTPEVYQKKCDVVCHSRCGGCDRDQQDRYILSARRSRS